MKLTYDLPEAVNMNAEKLDEMETLTRKAIDDNITAGMSALVARHGKIVYHKTIGNLTLAPDSPPAPRDTIHPIMSVSKVMTAACIMILADRGLLSPDDPVQQYIPEFQGEGKEAVRIHHLLTHTSGMYDDSIYRYWDEHKETVSPPEHIPDYLPRTPEWWLCILGAPLVKPTGKEMSYSSIGYNMLGIIVRIVSGQDIDTFAKTNLFGPLGMKDTSYRKDASQLEGRVIQRRPPPGEQENWISSPRCFDHVTPSGSVSSTAYDLAIFGQMFLNGGEYDGVRVLSEDSVRLMTTNQIPGIPAVWGDEVFQEAAWGYGFNTSGVQDNFPTNRAYYHGGYAGSRLLIDPVLDIVIISLKSLHFIEEVDYPGVMEAAAEACNDSEECKTPPLS